MAATAAPRTAKKPATRKNARTPGAASNGRAKALLAAATAAPPAAAGTLPVGSIEPDHFVNPRGAVDKKSPAFLELVASVKDLGLLEPIVVGPALVDGGKHPIIAGWRRYAAATAAKLKAVPVHQVAITDAKDALVAALAENVARDDMTPLSEARAIDLLMREHGYTQVQAGKAIGMAERTVRERVRLLKIHEASPDVGKAIDNGEVPMDAAVLLQQVAKVAPKTAAAMVAGIGSEIIEQLTEPWSASDLTKPVEVEHVIDWLQESAHDPDVAAAVGEIEPLYALGHHRRELPGRALPLTDEQRERWEKITPEQSWASQPPGFPILGEDVESARVAGQLLEIDGITQYHQNRTATWIAAEFFTKTWLEERLQRLEKAGEARAAAAAKARKKAAVETGKAGAQGLSSKEQAAAAEAKARGEREHELAHQRNVILGERTSSDRFAELALSLEAAKFFALLVLHSNHGSVLERGVRYCDPEHLTETEQKNGKVKRAYQLRAPGDTAVLTGRPIYDQLLLDKVRNATTPAEALAPVLRAYMLASEADETVVAQSNRAYFHMPYSHEDRLSDLLHAIAVNAGVLGDIDKEAEQRADAGKPLSEILTDEPATSPIDVSKLKGNRGEKILAVVTARPGITIPELADALSLNQNVLYRTLPALAQDGKVEKQGRGWHPVAS